MFTELLDPKTASPRRTGGFLFALGCILGFIGIYFPISAALNHEKSVFFSFTLLLIFPMPIGFGVLILGWGEKAIRVFGTTKYPTKAGYILLAILFLAGFGVYLLLRGFLISKGYRV